MCLGLHAPTILDNHSDECKTESVQLGPTAYRLLREKQCLCSDKILMRAKCTADGSYLVHSVHQSDLDLQRKE